MNCIVVVVAAPILTTFMLYCFGANQIHCLAVLSN